MAAERSGTLNLGIDGMMMTGAFAAISPLADALLSQNVLTYAFAHY
jgi:ABC-type uncharacterized transport system permease subunit